MHYRPIRVEFINPFVASTLNVFRTVLSCDLKRLPLYGRNGGDYQFELSGIIGLSGKAVGVVVLRMTRQVAIRVTETMLEEEHDDITPEVVDAVGELTNMIAGSAKAKLEELSLKISLPSVITGRDQMISLPSEVPPIGIPFESPWGMLAVEVSIVESVS